MGHDHRPQQGLHHESLSSQLISAFSTIDVDEVYALSAAENVSQYKYAIAVRDPRIHLPDWLAKSARVAALGKNIMLTDLQAWKPETTFDMMSNSQLFSVMGEQGIAMLSSPDLMLSGTFSRATDIEQVPAWRDGARRQELQRRMVGVAAKMYFEYGFAESTKPLFASAATWVAFTRLLNFLEVLAPVHSFHRANSQEEQNGGAKRRMRSNNEFGAGDVSSSICDFGSMTVQEKKSLASKLSKVSDDCTMAIDVQTGAQSRPLCKEPTDGWQADVVARRYQWKRINSNPAKLDNTGKTRELRLATLGVFICCYKLM